MASPQHEEMENPVLVKKVRFEANVVKIAEEIDHRHYTFRRQQKKRESKADQEKKLLFNQLIDKEYFLVARGWYEKNRMMQVLWDGLFEAMKIPKDKDLRVRIQALEDAGYETILENKHANNSLNGMLGILVRNGGWTHSTITSTPETKLPELLVTAVGSGEGSEFGDGAPRHAAASTVESTSHG